MNIFYKRKNRKITFDEDIYVDRYYVKDNIATIPLELEQERDLYMKHDYLQMQLSDSVCKYIEEIAYMIPLDIDIRIEIHCPKVTKFKQEKMRKAIKNNYGMEIDDLEYEIKIQNNKSFILLFLGVLLLIINILFDRFFGYSQLLSLAFSSFLCVIWWVAIWDLIEIQIFDKLENKEKRLCYQQLYDSEVTFVFEDEEKKNHNL